VAIAAILILTTLLLTVSLVSKIDTTSTNASEDSNSGFYAAEAGLNLRANEIRDTFEGFNRPSGNSPSSWEDCVDSDTTNDGDDDFLCNTSFNINNQQIVTYVKDITASTPKAVTIADGTYAGLSAQEYRYDVFSAALEAEGSNQFPTSILGMRFKSRLIPLFQFAVFYENDADFYNPPDMNINGRVHSNHDLYLAVASSSTLSINNTVTTAGTLYRGSKANEGSSQCVGTVRVATKKNDNTSYKSIDCNGNVITPYLESTTAPSKISDWGSQIEIGVEKLEVPPISDIDPSPGSKYWDLADLRIVLELDSSKNPVGITIRDKDNNIDNGLTGKLLQSCPVSSVTLRNDTDTTPSTYEWTDTYLYTNSTSGFNVGDVVTVVPDSSVYIDYTNSSHLSGYFDLDSNVIRSGGISSNSWMHLKRRLGHQPTSVVPSSSNIRKAVVSTSDTFYNYREKHVNTNNTNDKGQEGKNIRMLNVDVQALLDCAQSQNLMGSTALDDKTEGGLVWYFTVKGPGSSINRIGNTETTDASREGSTYGVRLYNGSHLYSKIPSAPEINGLTIVSDQAVYIRGDYNLTTDDPSTDVEEKWRPAAIIADTINVLSNAWKMDDSGGMTYSTTTDLPETKTLYSERIPSETTMNVALVAGTEISGGANGTATQLGTRSGGINNFFRLHEHWANESAVPATQNCDADYETDPKIHCFNYSGSFVSLSEPRRVNSDHCGSYNSNRCNIYTPPARNWKYDTNFDKAENLPPASPRVVYLTQELFERDFTYTSSEPNPSSLLAELPATSNFSSAILFVPTVKTTFSF
jgi:hypothetical protein